MIEPRDVNDANQFGRDSIIRAALEYIDSAGLDGFSMRGLARQIGAYPATIYWHVKDKSTLLAAVAHQLVEQVEMPEMGLPWDAFLRNLARNYRAVLHRHPRAAPLLTVTIVSNSELDFPFAESILRVLHDAGFRGQGLVDAYNTISGCLFGFVGLELAQAPDDKERWSELRQRELTDLDNIRFPLIAQHSELLKRGSFVVRWRSGTDQPMDDAFEAMIDTLLRGLRSRLNDSLPQAPPASR